MFIYGKRWGCTGETNCPPETVKAQEKPLFQITGSTNFLLNISDVQEAEPYASVREFKTYDQDPSIKLNAKMDLLQVPLVNAATQKTAETF